MKKLTNKDKAQVFDFIETLPTWRFIYEVILIELFNYKSKWLRRKILEFMENQK